MFGSNKLKDMVSYERECRDNDVKFIHSRITNMGELFDNRFLAQLKEIQKQAEVIDKLSTQLKTLANLVDCKIVPPTPAAEGGEVRKMTEAELANRKLFTSAWFNPLSYTPNDPQIVTDLQRGKTTKKVNKKKK